MFNENKSLWHQNILFNLFTAENFFKCYISIIKNIDHIDMDYKKKSLKKLNQNESYEEIDTRLASGWYVDSLENNKKKKYKTKEVTFKISKKI